MNEGSTALHELYKKCYVFNPTQNLKKRIHPNELLNVLLWKVSRNVWNTYQYAGWKID